MTDPAAPMPAAGATKSCPTCGSQGEIPCPTCSKSKEALPAAISPYVYSLGRVEPRHPNISTEKEVAQVAKRFATENMTDAHMLQKVLSDSANRYLVRQLSWVFRIEDQETFILYPRDPQDWGLLVAALRPAPRPTDLDAVVGIRGRNAPADMHNGLSLPIVMFDQLYAFDRDSLIKAIPRQEKTPAKQFEPAAEALLDRILHMTGNTGGQG
jgi:hypothetical protein